MKPSERILKAPYDGHEVTDAAGRKIILRKPSALDRYDLMRALGDDGQVSGCFTMAYTVLYVGLLDGQVFECPKTNSEIRAAIQRLEEHGMMAVADALDSFNVLKNNQGETEAIKK